jgi:hypothetical protein
MRIIHHKWDVMIAGEWIILPIWGTTRIYMILTKIAVRLIQYGLVPYLCIAYASARKHPVPIFPLIADSWFTGPSPMFCWAYETIHRMVSRKTHLAPCYSFPTPKERLLHGIQRELLRRIMDQCFADDEAIVTALQYPFRLGGAIHVPAGNVKRKAVIKSVPCFLRGLQAFFEIKSRHYIERGAVVELTNLLIIPKETLAKFSNQFPIECSLLCHLVEKAKAIGMGHGIRIPNGFRIPDKIHPTRIHEIAEYPPVLHLYFLITRTDLIKDPALQLSLFNRIYVCDGKVPLPVKINGFQHMQKLHELDWFRHYLKKPPAAWIAAQRQAIVGPAPLATRVETMRASLAETPGALSIGKGILKTAQARLQTDQNAYSAKVSAFEAMLARTPLATEPRIGRPPEPPEERTWLVDRTRRINRLITLMRVLEQLCFYDSSAENIKQTWKQAPPPPPPTPRADGKRHKPAKLQPVFRGFANPLQDSGLMGMIDPRSFLLRELEYPLEVDLDGTSTYPYQVWPIFKSPFYDITQSPSLKEAWEIRQTKAGPKAIPASRPFKDIPEEFFTMILAFPIGKVTPPSDMVSPQERSTSGSPVHKNPPHNQDPDEDESDEDDPYDTERGFVVETFVPTPLASTVAPDPDLLPLPSEADSPELLFDLGLHDDDVGEKSPPPPPPSRQARRSRSRSPSRRSPPKKGRKGRRSGSRSPRPQKGSQRRKHNSASPPIQRAAAAPGDERPHGKKRCEGHQDARVRGFYEAFFG